ncbi:TPA: Trk family potassium uptake protein [bacterium]|nr:Trk family potassium uptake protein [bacterium]
MRKDYNRKNTKFISIIDKVLIVIAIIAIFVLIIPKSIDADTELKRVFDIVDWVLTAVFILIYYVKWGSKRFNIYYLRNNWQEFFLIFLFFILPLPFLRTVSISNYFINEGFMAKLFIISNILLNSARLWQRITKTYLQPSLLIAISFLLLILIGTGFLLLPGATFSTDKIGTIDALFIATSSTCLSGLTIADTGSYFTRFGQITILSLIQIGGIGLVIIVAFFSLLLGNGFGLKESFIISEVFGTKVRSKASSVVALTIILVFALEFMGFLILYFAWAKPYDLGNGSAIYYSLFHSISAFCNSGFTLFDDSYIGFRGDIIFNITISFLIFLGGIGSVVMIDIIRSKIFRRGSLLLHTKLVLTVTLSLIILGYGCILITEWHNSLYELSVSEKFMSAFFLSLTSRTAGFTTINLSELTFATQFLLMFLMFIGASPTGTGGGIKTSTFGVFICYIWSMLKGEGATNAFRRSINIDNVRNALLLIVISAIIISFFGFLLILTEEGESIDILFNLFSAFNNVGFAVRPIEDMTDFGKVILIIAMFIGRVGPLTIVLALSQFGYPRKEIAYEYPEEDIIVG